MKKKSSSEKLIEGLEKAGLKFTKSKIVFTPALKKIKEDVEKFLKEKEEDRKRSEEYLKKHPMRFKVASNF